MERYSKYFDAGVIAEKIKQWQFQLLSDTASAASIGLKDPIDFSQVFSDSTCVKANIHFPVDWVLLRDAVRSFLLAIKTIRAKGLKHRMMEPALLMRQMNNLSIAMTHTRRRLDSKKQRKLILRKMKSLSQVINKHGMRYKQILKIFPVNFCIRSFYIKQYDKAFDDFLGLMPFFIKS